MTGTDRSRPTSAWEHLAPVAAAIGAGIGVVGFVTFVGGAIQYGRFAGVGVPASEAVSVVPTQTLIVLGAQAVAPAVGLGLGYAAMLFVVRQVRDRPREVSDRRNETRATFMAVYLASFGILAFAINGVPSDAVAALVIGCVGVLVTGLASAVAYRTPNEFWLATSTFIVVGLFVGGVQVARAWDNRDVRGAALVRENQKAIVGFFIAETGDRVFIGRLFFNHDGTEIDKSQSQILGVDKDEVTDLGIGPPKRPHAALSQAWEMAKGMCRAQLPRRVSDSKSPTPDEVEEAVETCAGGSPVPAT